MSDVEEAPIATAQMAARLSVSVETVRRMAREDLIPSIKVGRGPRPTYRFFESKVLEHLAAPTSDSWKQSAKSRGRRRSA